jgi:hypothetical protein
VIEFAAANADESHRRAAREYVVASTFNHSLTVGELK